MVTYNALCSFLKLDVMTRTVDEPELASRPFDVDRDGFLMAEGAGFVVLKRFGDLADREPVLGCVTGLRRLGRRPPPGGAGRRRRGSAASHDRGARGRGGRP